MPSKSVASRPLLALLCLAVAACTRTPTRYDSEFLAMGTQVQLSLLADSQDQAAALSAQVEQTLRRQAIDWYPWTHDATGELKQLNAALAAGQAMNVSPPLRALLQTSLELHRNSEGYFDPAVAPLTQAWGFDDLDTHPAIPAANLLDRWRSTRPTLADLNLSGATVSSARHDLQLDLGAIAKGYALQLALLQLKARGCSNAALNLGGQLAVMGEAMAQQVSAVLIRDPRAQRGLATVQLTAAESISTSGDYERVAVVNGQRVHHLFDPHTGLPVSHTQAVTVISSDATLADAASTALMAAGPQHWQRIARQLGVHEVLRVDATGAIEVTAALYARLHWRADLSQRITRIEL